MTWAEQRTAKQGTLMEMADGMATLEAPQAPGLPLLLAPSPGPQLSPGC